jgi:hypothetical protein
VVVFLLRLVKHTLDRLEKEGSVEGGKEEGRKGGKEGRGE